MFLTSFKEKQENLERAKLHTICKDIENSYLSPCWLFSHVGYNEIGYEEEMQLCEDLLILCDKLIVASDLSEGVEREITLAEKCNIGIS